MNRQIARRILDRSRWVSDIAVALGECEQLLLLLEADGRHPAEAMRLRTRVQLARTELELLNRIPLAREYVLGTPWRNPKAERA